MKINICVGGRFHASQLAKILIKHKFNVYIYTSSPIKNWPVETQRFIKFIPMPFSIIFYLLKLNTPKILKYIDRVIFDFILSIIIRNADINHMWAGFSLITIKKIKKRNSNSKIILERSCPHISIQKKILSKESFKYNQKLDFDYKIDIKRQIKEYYLSDNIYVPSEYTRNSFQKSKHLLDRIKIIRISSNINLPNTIYKYEIKPDNLIIGFIGDFSLRKGIFTFLNAFDKSNLKCKVYLKLPKLSLRNKRNLNLYKKSNFYKIKGYYKSISKFYESISVLCIPSIDEGFGMVVLEAIQHKIPIIVRNTVGAKEIIDINKFGYEFQNEQELISILNKLDTRKLNSLINNYNSNKISLKFDKDYENSILSNYYFLYNS